MSCGSWCECYLAVFLMSHFLPLFAKYTLSILANYHQMLRVYGVGGNLLKAVHSFYVDSRACVLVENDVSELFSVNVGLRRGCVM